MKQRSTEIYGAGLALLLWTFSYGCIGWSSPARIRVSPEQLPAILHRVSMTQDTLIPLIDALPRVYDLAESPGCHFVEPVVRPVQYPQIGLPCSSVLYYRGRDARILAVTLAEHKRLLLRELDRYDLPPVRYHFESVYPAVPGTHIQFSVWERRYYVPDETTDSISFLITRLAAQLRSDAAGRPVDLRIDVLPVGSKIRVQALEGDPHMTVANQPILGLWRGKYDFWVYVEGEVKGHGQLDFFDHPGEVLWCRFNRGGCVQVQ